MLRCSCYLMLEIPADRVYPPAGTPIFYGAATHDYVCVPSDGYEAFKNENFAKGQVTTREYDADHWLILSRASKICRDLEAWIQSFYPPLTRTAL